MLWTDLSWEKHHFFGAVPVIVYIDQQLKTGSLQISKAEVCDLDSVLLLF